MTFPLAASGALRPALKILTDYPRDDLAHDEVRQALLTACLSRGLDCADVDVGAIPGMDTVSAGFKTAQLALNTRLGYGHVFHANCAPRKNMDSVRSAGEKIVVGMTRSGAALLVVNAGYALAPFRAHALAGDSAFFQTAVPSAGSQFRSRDFFPDALAGLAAHLAAQYARLGAEGIRRLLDARAFGEILSGLSWLGGNFDAASMPQCPAGAVLYVDSFGNIKTAFRHEDLLRLYRPGEVLAVKIGNAVCDAVMGREGFSQGEGMLALTAGSSGWETGGEKTVFTEIMLRGGRAADKFGAFQPGDPVTVLRESDLQKAVEALHAADAPTAQRLDLHHMPPARLVSLLKRAGLIAEGCDSTALAAALAAGDLPGRL